MQQGTFEIASLGIIGDRGSIWIKKDNGEYFELELDYNFAKQLLNDVIKTLKEKENIKLYVSIENDKINIIEKPKK